MDHKNHDKVFFASFGKVMGALFAIFMICIVAARWVVGSNDLTLDPEATARLAERIKPVAQVVTDPSALLKMAAASKIARAAYSGEQVVQKICGACHNTGMLGAPKTGDKAAWGTRLSANGGLNGLVASAIKGKNTMPPRGGDADLSDDEIKAAVELLLK